MAIDIQARFAELQSRYATSNSADKANVLLVGKSGSGKTHFLKTCPKPVLVHSFDPGGLTTLRTELLDPASKIYAEDFSDENSLQPKQWDAWARRFKELSDGKAFESIGTYCIDSATMWLEALINKCQDENKAKDGRQAYMMAQNPVRNAIKACGNLPAHFILTAHLSVETNEEGNVIEYDLNVFKSMRGVLPLLFNEVYLLDSSNSPTGTEHFIRYEPKGYFKFPKTRMGGSGKLTRPGPPNPALAGTFPADMRKILQACGYPYADKA